MQRRALVELGSLLLVVFLCVRCGSTPPLPMTYPFIELQLGELPAQGVQVQVDATFAGKSRTEMFSGNDMLQRITISLPPDGRGSLEMQITVRDEKRCILASGISTVMVTQNDVQTVTVRLDVQSPPICPMGPPIDITVQKSGDGKGDITATPATLSCDVGCTSKMASLEAGTIVSLSATPGPATTSTTSNFDGWSGACTGTGTCFVTLAQTATVTARFSCHGWCPETLPTVTANLNGVFGLSSNRAIAVGDSGTVLQWDGTTWKPINHGITTKNLRGISGIPGTSNAFVVGDSGTIINTIDGGNGWATMNSTTTMNLRAVFLTSASEAYAVGDKIGNNYPWLIYKNNLWGDPNLGGVDNSWNAVWGIGPGQYYVVGSSGRTVQSSPYLTPSIDSRFNLLGLFGLSSTTMTAVGSSGALFRLNPAGSGTWNPMTPPPSSVTDVTLRAIHGTASGRMYAVGDGGTVWRYDVGTWRTEQIPVTTQLNSVFLINDNDVFVVGQAGLIYHKRP